MVEIRIPLDPTREGVMPARGHGLLRFSQARASRCRKGADVGVVVHLAFQLVHDDGMEGCRTRLGLRGGRVTMAAVNHAVQDLGPVSPLGDVTVTNTIETGAEVTVGVGDGTVSATHKGQMATSFVIKPVSSNAGKNSATWVFASHAKKRLLHGQADPMTVQMTPPEQPRESGCSCRITFSTVAADWYAQIVETPMDLSWLKTVFLKVRLAGLLREIVRVDREEILLSGQWTCERPCRT